MGRRRKRSEPVGQVEYFYPSSRKIQSAPLRIKKNDTNLRHSSTDINDNIGVTVIMPEGESITLEKRQLYYHFYSTFYRALLQWQKVWKKHRKVPQNNPNRKLEKRSRLPIVHCHRCCFGMFGGSRFINDVSTINQTFKTDQKIQKRKIGRSCPWTSDEIRIATGHFWWWKFPICGQKLTPS